tara:strand:- start:58 stop:489 length:432 start_codon:yes stop_codon:yes gene_type:complete
MGQAQQALERTDIGILIIDDDADFLEIVKTGFEGVGFEHVYGSERPVQAIFGLHDLNPLQVLFLDTEVPHIRGYDFCRALRDTGLYDHLAIIGMSDRDDHDLPSKWRAAGADRFYQKKRLHGISQREAAVKNVLEHRGYQLNF